jgi:hypothetical protein
VKYIIRLTERGLPPTNEMIHSFTSGVVKKEVGEKWVLRFVERNKGALITKQTTRIDRNRHQADSEHKYSPYLDLLESKISAYSVLLENTYNMDEKGFMTGPTRKCKRLFSRALWESRQVTDSLEDSNREWVSVLACIGADGNAPLPTVVNNQLSGAREVRIDLIDHSFRPSNYQHRLNSYLMGLDTYLEVKD